MSAPDHATDSANVGRVAKILGIDWHVLIGFVGILGTVVAFLYSILNTSQLNEYQIGELTKEYTTLSNQYTDITKHLDTIERSVGRIEGQVNPYGLK